MLFKPLPKATNNYRFQQKPKGKQIPMTTLNSSDENKFMDWYGRLSKYKKLDPNPDPKTHFYDYRGYWKDQPMEAESMFSVNSDAHFPDTYKLPGHPTFSDESRYATPENPGGHWNGDTFIPPQQKLKLFSK